MKSITIHDLDAYLDGKIKERAKKEGTSINKTIKKILGEALTERIDAKPDHSEDFKDLFGIWPDSEQQEFLKNTQQFEAIQPEDWQ
jgi:hypothetical protein